MSKRLQIVALALPILLLVLVVGRSEWHLLRADTWHFAIQGYDPRYLLRGHYMRFRLAVSPYETIESCRVGDPACCYCLETGPGLEARAPLASSITAADQCDAFVRTDALHALDRFYIPEDGRTEIESILRSAARQGRAHLAVAVSSSGQPMIEALLIDGQPIRAATPEEAQAQ